MHELKSDNPIQYDAHRNAYIIDNLWGRTVLNVEKRDKNGKMLSEGITLQDLQVVCDHITGKTKHQSHKPASLALEALEDVPENTPVIELGSDVPEATETSDIPAEVPDKPMPVEDDEITDIPVKEEAKPVDENGIPIKEDKPVPKIDLSGKKKKKIKVGSGKKRTLEDFRALCKKHIQEGFTHYRLTPEATEYFKNSVITNQKYILMEHPEYRHKLEKHTKIDVTRLPVKKKGVSKRDKDRQLFMEA